MQRCYGSGSFLLDKQEDDPGVFLTVADILATVNTELKCIIVVEKVSFLQSLVGLLDLGYRRKILFLTV